MITTIEKNINVELADEEIKTLENAGTLITQIANNLDCSFEKVTRYLNSNTFMRINLDENVLEFSYKYGNFKNIKRTEIQKKDLRFREEWVITIARTDSDSFYTYTFYGTEKEVKEILIKMVISDGKEINSFSSGTRSIDEIDDIDGELYAYNCFDDYSYRYCACKLDNLEPVTKYYPV